MGLVALADRKRSLGGSALQDEPLGRRTRGHGGRPAMGDLAPRHAVLDQRQRTLHGGVGGAEVGRQRVELGGARVGPRVTLRARHERRREVSNAPRRCLREQDARQLLEARIDGEPPHAVADELVAHQRVDRPRVRAERGDIGLEPGAPHERERGHELGLGVRETAPRGVAPAARGASTTGPSPPGLELGQGEVAHLARAGFGQQGPPGLALRRVEATRDLEELGLPRGVEGVRIAARVGHEDDEQRTGLGRENRTPRSGPTTSVPEAER